MSSISVIICTYTEQRLNDLMAAVASVQQQALPPDEIIIVVDHNTALIEYIRAQLPTLIVIENKGIGGLSDARNSGIAAASGQLLAFLDDDSIASREWLQL